MSQEIRRLHRKKTEFTNFSSSETPESIIKQASRESSKRRRRRRNDSDPDINNDFSKPNPTESSPPNIEEDSEKTSPSQPQMISSYSPISNNNIDSIRADLLEDISHSKLADSDYSNDTHDWGGDSQHLSEDYWHFLGRYE